MYVLAGSTDGTFAAPQKLLDKTGNILRIGQYWDYDTEKWTGVAESKYKDKLGISAAAVDWDDDEDLDLVLGSLQGNVFIRLNEGSPAEPAFATESIMLASGDDPIEVPGGDSIPKIADFDGDGRFDILTGSGAGGVYWLRNVGTKGAPAFVAAVEIVPTTAAAEIVPAADVAADPGNPPAEPAWPGERTHVCATDYDGDGDLDLLVGDFNSQGKEMHGWVWLFRRL